MDRVNLPLTGLRVFEVAARQGSFTRAAHELCVTQAAISHQILKLEEFLGFKLFYRTRNGLVLTQEAEKLKPILTNSFNDISQIVTRLKNNDCREILTLGVVTSFATGWLIPHLNEFHRQYPEIDIRVSTHNNKIDLAREAVDAAICFGDTLWPGHDQIPILETTHSPLCAPEIAAELDSPHKLSNHILLGSYRAQEWENWLKLVNLSPQNQKYHIFDSSIAMAELAAMGQGVALLPLKLFEHYLNQNRLVRPFRQEINTGHYWLIHANPNNQTVAFRCFRDWLLSSISGFGQDNKAISAPPMHALVRFHLQS